MRPKLGALEGRGGELINELFGEFCNQEGIQHGFSSPWTPQQNKVVKWRNKSLVEMRRTLLNDQGIPHNFLAKAINTSCYTCKTCVVRHITCKTTYEIYYGKILNISHLKVLVQVAIS